MSGYSTLQCEKYRKVSSMMYLCSIWNMRRWIQAITYSVVCTSYIAICAQTDVRTILHKLDIPVHETSLHNYPVYRVQRFADTARNHYDSRHGEPIQYIILHYTHSHFTNTMKAFTSTSPDYPVSAHYVIAQDGTIIHVVPDTQRAWHAGDSFWNGEYDLNSRSIGIEIINTGFTKTDDGRTWHPFAEDQIAAVGTLCQHIVKQYNIKPQHVLGHADIAPHRKHDPGVVFPWSRLYYEYGVGAWLENTHPRYIRKRYAPHKQLPHRVDKTFVLSQLQQYGYNITNTAVYTEHDTAAVRAFKAHFSDNQETSEYNGIITYDDMIWSWGLVAKYQ